MLLPALSKKNVFIIIVVQIAFFQEHLIESESEFITDIQFSLKRCRNPFHYSYNNCQDRDGVDAESEMIVGFDYLFSCKVNITEVKLKHIVPDNFSYIGAHASVEFFSNSQKYIPTSAALYPQETVAHYPILSSDFASFAAPDFAKLFCGLRIHRDNQVDYQILSLNFATVVRFPGLECVIELKEGLYQNMMKLSCELQIASNSEQEYKSIKVEYCSDRDITRDYNCSNFSRISTKETQKFIIPRDEFSFSIFPKYFRILKEDAIIRNEILPSSYHHTILKPTSV